MKHFLSVLALFAASVAFGQDLTIDGNVKTVQVDQVIVTKVDKLLVQSLPFTIKAPPGAFDYRWSFPATVSVLDMGDTLKVTAAPKGAVTVGVVIKTIDFDKKKVDSKFSELSFLVGEVPVPIPPVPDPPKPDPKPEPKPDVSPPIPAKGMHVLVIYGEDGEGNPILTRKQSAELYGEEINKYLNAKCVKDDGTAGFRIWKSNVNLSGASEYWRQAMGRTRSKEPWIIISDAPGGSYEGPLPDGGIIDLLKKYGEK